MDIVGPGLPAWSHAARRGRMRISVGPHVRPRTRVRRAHVTLGGRSTRPLRGGGRCSPPPWGVRARPWRLAVTGGPQGRRDSDAQRSEAPLTALLRWKRVSRVLATEGCSDGKGEFSEARLELAGLGIEAELVVSTAQVLDERMPAADNLGGADAFSAAHRSRSGLQSAVIGFNRVVGVLLQTCHASGTSSSSKRGYRRGPVRGHLGRPSRRVQCPGEEPAGRRQIPLRRGQDINDLPMLVDRPVQLHPPPSDLQIRLVH